MCLIIFYFFLFYDAEMYRKLWTKSPAKKRVPWARCQKNFKFTLYIYIFLKLNKKNYNRVKELYWDATTFRFRFFIVYLPKKNENWKKNEKNGTRLPILP